MDTIGSTLWGDSIASIIVRSNKERFADINTLVSTSYSDQLTKIYNEIDHLSTSDVKEHNINEYISTLRQKTENVNEVISNMENNIKAAGRAYLLNELNLNILDSKDIKGINIKQTNEMTQKLTQGYKGFIQQVTQVLDKADSIYESEFQGSQTADAGQDSSIISDQVNKSEQDSSQETVQESFMDINTEVSTSKSKQETLQTSIDRREIINNTDIYNKISTAYDKSVEVLNHMKNVKNNVIGLTSEGDISAINKLNVNISNVNGLKGLNVEQTNSLIQNIELIAAVSAIDSLDVTNEVKAIVSDMIGLDQSGISTQTTDSTGSQSTDTTQKSSQVTSQTIKTSIIAIIVIAFIIIIFIRRKVLDSYFDSDKSSQLLSKTV